MGTIILFYKYISIKYPKVILKWQKQLCTDLGLTGRIIIAHEGINGTVAGPDFNITQYKQAMDNHDLFGEIDFKESPGNTTAFPRLKVMLRDEIVHLGIPADQLTVQDRGEHLSPQEAHALLDKAPEDLIVIDCRNQYETAIGTMPQALKPPTKHFREFPDYIKKHKQQFTNKQILMYCTGGIRCERASALIKQVTNAHKVYQIEGGIHRYVEQFPDGHFRGKNYVFDGRVSVRVNNDVLGACSSCNKACDDYINCRNAVCNRHVIMCASCTARLESSCSVTCQEAINTGKNKCRPPFTHVCIEP